MFNSNSMRISSPILAFLFSGILLSYPQYSSGADPSEMDTSRFSIAHQFVESSFEPQKAFLLQEQSSGEVIQYPAQVSLAPSEVGSEFIVGAQIFNEKVHSGGHFAFFLIDQNGSFFSAPIIYWSRDALEKNYLSPLELRAEAEESKQRADKLELELEVRSRDLVALKQRVVEVAGVSGIVDLQTELEELKSRNQEMILEQQRLKELVLLGRKEPDPQDSKLWRRDLSAQLREAAQATAMADRLNRRRREAAMSSLKDKLRLIKETRQYDPKELASEVLELRKKRRNLETRLNIAADTQTDF